MEPFEIWPIPSATGSGGSVEQAKDMEGSVQLLAAVCNFYIYP